MKRKISKIVDGEIELVDESISAWCSCCSESGYDQHKVPVKKDTNECELCGSTVWYGTAEEISNNARR